MARFRPKQTIKLVNQLVRLNGAAEAVSWTDEPVLPREFRERYAMLQRQCRDQSSHLRLGRLIHRLMQYDYGVRESALAEMELASQLIRVGAAVIFLPESQAKTADLECRVGSDRFFVEVTAMVGSRTPRRNPIAGLAHEGDNLPDRGAILIHRVLARVRQKAKQLADYVDPVVLSLSIPRAELQGAGWIRRRNVSLDLRAMAGSTTMLLTGLRHLSAVLITLWDVEPLPVSAATRLANVDVHERNGRQAGHPRVRLLIRNPSAATPLTERQRDSFDRLL
ncbi:protein of unknown function [Nitrospira japonica]|uniref:Uncharacterized protein n=2 Tax=Nitrospira japonica TaxID=1325564 RepID=A0A1W1I046_9BACT|nr:protein of unknown function [Nitrospira japonica]